MVRTKRYYIDKTAAESLTKQNIIIFIQENDPNIPVQVEGKIYQGKVKGFKTNFPKVYISEIKRSGEYSWNAIDRVLHGQIPYLLF